MFLHTPLKENAMMFVVDIARFICDIIDTLRRTGGRRPSRQSPRSSTALRSATA